MTMMMTMNRWTLFLLMFMVAAATSVKGQFVRQLQQQQSGRTYDNEQQLVSICFFCIIPYLSVMINVVFVSFCLKVTRNNNKCMKTIVYRTTTIVR